MIQIFNELARRAGFITCALIMLAGCATSVRVPPTNPQLEWQQRQTQLNQIQAWNLKGRIGIITEKKSGTVSLHWQQTADHYQIRIIAPLGQGSLHITGDRKMVEMKDSDGNIMQADDVEALIWQRTGWRLPIQQLKSWVLGLPGASDEKDIVLDEYGRLQHFNTADWQIKYPKYNAVGVYQLPAKVEVENPELKLKLVIKHWDLPK